MKYLYIKIILGMLLFTSCTKDIEIKAPEFEVTTEHSTYQKGKPIVFILKGNPQFLSFYSGEVGYNYALRDESLNVSIPIQGGTTLPKREYIYTFIKSGTYKVHFVGANTSASERKEIVRELTITITD